jgi:hypothetical protein
MNEHRKVKALRTRPFSLAPAECSRDEIQEFDFLSLSPVNRQYGNFGTPESAPLDRRDG